MNIQTLEQHALHLAVQDRAYLAEKLLASLDNLSEQETEKLWLQEAARRAVELDEGKVQPVSADEVEAKINALLQ